MALETIGLIILAVAGWGTFFIREYSRVRLKHEFDVRLAELNHKLSLEKVSLEGELKKELSLVEAEIALHKEIMNGKNELENSEAIMLAGIRAKSYPRLVTILREIKERMENLDFYKHAKLASVDLTETGEVSELIIKSMHEILGLAEEFNKEVSELRIYLNKSDYDLPTFAADICISYLGDDHMMLKHTRKHNVRPKKRDRSKFTWTKNKIEITKQAYAEDVAVIAGEFYKSLVKDIYRENTPYEGQYKYILGPSLDKLKNKLSAESRPNN